MPSRPCLLAISTVRASAPKAGTRPCGPWPLCPCVNTCARSCSRGPIKTGNNCLDNSILTSHTPTVSPEQAQAQYSALLCSQHTVTGTAERTALSLPASLTQGWQKRNEKQSYDKRSTRASERQEANENILQELVSFPENMGSGISTKILAWPLPNLLIWGKTPGISVDCFPSCKMGMQTPT